MSQLSEMIKELCPDGVEYRKLGELGDFFSGLIGKAKEDFSEGNAYFIPYMNVYSNPEVKMTRLEYVNVTENEAQNLVQCGDVLFTGSSETRNESGLSSVLTIQPEEKVYLNSFCFGYRFVNPQMFLPAFTKHLFRSSEMRYQIVRAANGVTRFNISKKKMANVVIPVPPLPVQNEIVKLLDNFTELTAELTAELTLRKKQYSFYRDSLLNFSRDDVDVEWKTLGEMCRLKAGTAIAALNISTNATADSAVPCYGGNGLRGYVRQANQSEDAPLIGRQGALCGNVCYATAPYYATEHAVVVDGLGHFDNRFLFHILRNMNLSQYKTAGAQPGLSVKRLNQAHIAVPTIEAQKRIADILDRFDTLCNDLSQGLPAEIAARKKQYEYYRDKLLTFRRKGA